MHLLGNDYFWKRAAEPLDEGTRQVERVSAENPAHSLMLRFGKEVAAYPGIPVAIIPASLGGSSLSTQWQRDPADPLNRGSLYGSSVYRVSSQRYAHPIRGVIWYQGESDVGRGTEAYQQALQQLLANYRTDLLNPELFFGNCQLATYAWVDLAQWVAIQEAQRRQALADPQSAMVALVDLPRSDVIHLSVEGYKEAGRRLAFAVLDGSCGQELPLGPQLLSVAAGGPNSMVLTYDKPVSGGAPDLYRVTDGEGAVGIDLVLSGSTSVTLQTQRPLVGPTSISYGYSLVPDAAWVVGADGEGAAAAFGSIVLSP